MPYGIYGIVALVIVVLVIVYLAAGFLGVWAWVVTHLNKTTTPNRRSG
jgi:hypothetical protein